MESKAEVTRQVKPYPKAMLPAREFTFQVTGLLNRGMRISDIRRENARYLARQANPKHPIKGFAERLDKSSSLISQYIGKKPSKNIGDDVAQEIERAFELAPGWMDAIHPEIHAADTDSVEILTTSEPSASYDAPPEAIKLHLQKVPVVGAAQGGDDGYHEETQYPVGHGDGYVYYPCADLNAYALQCKGESMFPRYRHGEFIVITPNAEVNPGDEVLVKTSAGKVMFKILAYIRNGQLYLDSLKEGFAQIVVPMDEVEKLHLIAGRATHALWRPD